jgi:AcrR family transcriptional regulator
MSVTLPTVHELPVVQDEQPLRADAARNRDKVLAAAEKLFTERGFDCVSMDAVAAAAGVGKGTLFRGFGDRVGLMAALLSEHERRLQEDMIRGAAPIGPGAPPVERLIAFAERWFELLEQHGALIREASVRGARYRSAPYRFQRTHVALLVREAAPDSDVDYIADALLAALSPEHVEYLRAVQGMSNERMLAGWADLVRRFLS